MSRAGDPYTRNRKAVMRTTQQGGEGAAGQDDATAATAGQAGAAQASPARGDEEQAAGSLARRWRQRLVWTVVMAAAAVALFEGMLRVSRTYGMNSDGAGIALQGWDFVHGNLLLSGWWTADVSFYTFEIPVDGLVALAHGLGGDVVRITAAIAYTALTCVAALTARGRARGAEGIVRALLAAGIMLAPGDIMSTSVLLGSPDHIGVSVPILLALLLVDRARERWWVPAATCLLLLWAQLDDPMAEFAAAFAVAVVCLARAGLGLARHRGRAAWYDAALGAAAVVSYLLTRLAVHLIRAAGGLSMRQLSQATKIQPLANWPHQIQVTAQNILILFGADFHAEHSPVLIAATAVHLAGVALAVIGIIAGIAALVRRGDRVTQSLTVGTLVTLGAGAFASPMTAGYAAHEIAVVLPFGAVLAGRTVGPWLLRRRAIRLSVVPALGVVLAAYLAFFGYYTTQHTVQSRDQTLADWLMAHHLTDGLGRYWTGSSTRLLTAGRVRISPVESSPKDPYPWITRPSWYDPSRHTANFVVAGTDPQGGMVFPASAVRKAFGKPAHVYRFDQYIIMVYDKNLLRHVRKPVQPSPDTGRLGL